MAPGEHRDRRGGLHEPASPRRDARPSWKPTAPALATRSFRRLSPAAPSLARVVGGGLAAAVVVALRIPTNPRHSCGEVVHGLAPAPEGTVVQAPDGSYQVKRNGQWVASDAAANRPPARRFRRARYRRPPPGIHGRHEADRRGLARLRSTDNLDASLDHLDTANSQVSTGPGRVNGNLNPVNLLANMDQNYNDMQAAAGKLQVGNGPAGPRRGVGL